MTMLETRHHLAAMPQPTSYGRLQTRFSSTLRIHSALWTISLITLISHLAIQAGGQQQAAHGGTHGHSHGNQPQNHHHHHHHHHMKGEPAAPRVDPYQHIKVLIPNLPPSHYQFWLKNHPRAAKIFEEVCAQAVVPGVLQIQDLAQFHLLHANLSFEQPRYLQDLDYGKSVLARICYKIREVNKSCWGYENNCQEIHLMPECQGTSSGQAGGEQEQKIKWFSQADFGYILDRRKEMSKYCAPDKKANPSEVSSLECAKHFTTCRGTNLFVHFNTSSSRAPGLGLSGLSGSGATTSVSELGGWSCDLQELRIKEEAGRSGKHQSWYSELAGYKLLDGAKAQETRDLVLDKQVIFVKVSSASNLDDYLGTFINLYATIHLNNRFSDDTQIMLWADKLPSVRRFEQLWYAFSRHPPMSVGQFHGKSILFKRFIFAMPPKMVDGLHTTDKQLIEGCAKSGLYSAFHKHVTHRMNTPQLYDLNFHRKTQGRLLRVAILSRAGSGLRETLNEQQLEAAIKAHSKTAFVQILKYSTMDFNHLLVSMLNSDIAIGLHGTGLAYSLFLPDWAGLIELYDCKKSRYRDLARLRGVSYHGPSEAQLAAGAFVQRVPVAEDSEVWRRYNRSQLANNDEFNNYQVNVDEFMKLYLEASQKVLKARDDYFRRQQEDLVALSSALARGQSGPTNQEEPKANLEEQAEKTTTTTTSTTTSTTTTSAPAMSSAAPTEPPTQEATPGTKPIPASDIPKIDARAESKNTHNEL